MTESITLALSTETQQKLLAEAHRLGITPNALAETLLRNVLAATTSQTNPLSAQRYEVRTAATAQRSKKLGSWGEQRAMHHLTQAGYTSVCDMNEGRPNHPFADIHAELDGKKYCISVKTRNRYQRNGTENTRYKLPLKQLMWAARMQAQGYIPAWIAITLDAGRRTYSCYFGELSVLEGRRGILMSSDARQQYRCLANEEPCEEVEHLRNTY